MNINPNGLAFFICVLFIAAILLSVGHWPWAIGVLAGYALIFGWHRR